MEVCVQQLNAVDAGGNTVSAFFPATLGDQVFITEALYNPVNHSLSIRASSSDQVVPQTLTALGLGNLAGGVLTVANVTAPPSKVRVTSSARGANEFQVSTGFGPTGAGTATPVALNDSATVLEDSGATAIAVLANDTVGGNPIVIPPPVGTTVSVSLVALPLKGTAVVNANGTISYTPNLNASGADSFTYTVTVNTIVSNVAIVSVTITPVNDLPTAVNDTFSGIVNQAISLPVLANDTDPDGQADIVAAVIQSLPQAGATLRCNGTSITTTPTVCAGNLLSLIATAGGAYTFTYRAQDAAGATSANLGTVTVNVAAANDVLTITAAEFRTGTRRWDVTGTTTVGSGNVITVRLVRTGQVIGTVTVTAPGVWTLRVLPSNVIAVNGDRVQATSTAGGTSPSFAVRVRQ